MLLRVRMFGFRPGHLLSTSEGGERAAREGRRGREGKDGLERAFFSFAVCEDRREREMEEELARCLVGVCVCVCHVIWLLGWR